MSGQDLYNNLDLWATGLILKQLDEQREMSLKLQVVRLAEKHGIGGYVGEMAKQLASMGYVIADERCFGPAAVVDRDGKIELRIEAPLPRILKPDAAMLEQAAKRACYHGKMDCIECRWREGRGLDGGT